MLPKGSVGAELGVFRGEFSKQILRIVQPRELHLVDAWWEVFGEFYPDWGPDTEFGRLRTRDAFAEARRAVADARDVKIVFHVGDDVALLKSMADSYFDWVYIDTSHQYEQTRKELTVAWTKVRAQGLVCGDDWTDDPNSEHHGVAKAVREFIGARRLEVKRLGGGQWCLRRT